MVAKSETEFPTTTEFAESVVVRVGEVLVTVSVSGPHGLCAALLLLSPLYAACQVNDPVELNMIETGPALDEETEADLVVTGVVAHPVPA
jgi:hypothetical protein